MLCGVIMKACMIKIEDGATNHDLFFESFEHCAYYHEENAIIFFDSVRLNDDSRIVDLSQEECDLIVTKLSEIDKRVIDNISPKYKIIVKGFSDWNTDASYEWEKSGFSHNRIKIAGRGEMRDFEKMKEIARVISWSSQHGDDAYGNLINRACHLAKKLGVKDVVGSVLSCLSIVMTSGFNEKSELWSSAGVNYQLTEKGYSLKKAFINIKKFEVSLL